MGAKKEEGASAFSVVPTDRTRGNGHELKHRLHLNTRNTSVHSGWSNSGIGCLGCCGVSLLGDIQKLSGHGPGQPALGGHA